MVEKTVAEHLGAITARLDAHADQLVEIKTELKTTNSALVEYNTQLAIHIEGVKSAKELIALKEKETEGRLQPLEKHVIQVSFLAKVGICSIAVPGAIYYLFQIIHFIRS